MRWILIGQPSAYGLDGSMVINLRNWLVQEFRDKLSVWEIVGEERKIKRWLRGLVQVQRSAMSKA